MPENLTVVFTCNHTFLLICGKDFRFSSDHYAAVIVELRRQSQATIIRLQQKTRWRQATSSRQK